MKLNMIFAMDSRNGIGFENKLPFRSKIDTMFFKDKTTNKVVVMGRKTYDSLPSAYKPLPNRYNVVLTNGDLTMKNKIADCVGDLEYVNSIDPILKTYNEIFVIGGASIYNTIGLDYNFDNIYITQVYKEYKCDTFIDQGLINKIKDPSLYKSKSILKWSDEDEVKWSITKYSTLRG